MNIHNIFSFLSFLDKKDKTKFFLLNICFIKSAILDASIIAGLYFLLNSFIDWESTHELIKSSFDSKISFSYFILFLTFYSILFRAFTTFFQLHYVRNLEHNIIESLVNLYLNKSPEWISNNNTSDLIKKLLNEVGAVVAMYIYPITIIVSQIFILIFVTSSLFILNPIATAYWLARLGLLILL